MKDLTFIEKELIKCYLREAIRFNQKLLSDAIANDDEEYINTVKKDTEEEEKVIKSIIKKLGN